MKFKTVIFDLDGTLLNTLGDLTAAVNAVMEHHGFETANIEQVRERVGNGIRNLISRSVPEGSDDSLISECTEEMIQYYSHHLMVYTRPYDGLPAAIKQLDDAGMKIAVLSNKYDDGAKHLMNHFFPWRADLVFGERKGVPRKPDPTAVFEIMRELNADPETTAYVGDSSVDMKTAKNAGLLAIGVSWGFRSRADLEESGADIILSHPSELVSVLMDGLYDVDQLEAAFTGNQFAFSYFETAAEAREYLLGKCAGKKVAMGGSMTLQELDLYDAINENGQASWHWKKDPICTSGDVFLTSANALSETGEIVNIDGNGNRVADAIWGFEECYVVCGYNKLAADLPAAMRRARRIAGPLNAKRLNRKTPCVTTGVCMNCRSPERICKVMTVTMQPPSSFKHYEVVLIGETIGY